jgi:hypothetical protein
VNKEEDTPRKLTTATQPQFARTVIRISLTRGMNGAAQIEETATQLQDNLRKSEKLNFRATEQASLLTVALPRTFLVSAVLTGFCDSFLSFDDMKG